MSGYSAVNLSTSSLKTGCSLTFEVSQNVIEPDVAEPLSVSPSLATAGGEGEGDYAERSQPFDRASHVLSSVRRPPVRPEWSGPSDRT